MAVWGLIPSTADIEVKNSFQFMTALQFEKQLFNDSFWNLYGRWDQHHKAWRIKKQTKKSSVDNKPAWRLRPSVKQLKEKLVKWKLHSVSNSLQPHGLYSPWNSPGQNTGLGSLSLFQRIFPTEGLNPGLPHYRQILYQLSHKGSPRMLELVTYPFSSGSSRPRNQTRVSCIAGGFFTNWAMREKLGDP